MTTPATRYGPPSTARHYGKHRGIVTDTADPRSLGRLRARVPEVLADVESGWAWPSVPYAGDGSGLFAVPPPGTGVWIEFEAGDVSRPIWTGCWWGDSGLPADEAGTAATPTLKILRSEKGLLVALDDDARTVTVSDSDGANLVTVAAQDGTVTVKANSKVVVEAPQVELTANAAHALVFGDQLLQYLTQVAQTYQAHMHPGQANAGGPVSPAPPQPTLAPPSSALLSTKVTTG